MWREFEYGKAEEGKAPILQSQKIICSGVCLRKQSEWPLAYFSVDIHLKPLDF